MMKKKALIFLQVSIGILVLLSACNEDNKSTKSESEVAQGAYLNQSPPGKTPSIFAPALISKSDEYEFGSVFSEKADSFYYAVRLNEDWKAEIRYSTLKNNTWTTPEKLILDTVFTYNDPFLSQKGDKLYFVSNRTANGEGEPVDFDIWYLQMTKSGWSEPINAGDVINSEKDEFYISITNTGSIYFVSNSHTREEDKWNFDVYYSKFIDGEYQLPVRLGDSINTEHFECDPYFSPDETYMIFSSSRPGGYGAGDLYISFKNKEGNWTTAKNMGNSINTKTHEFCPQVTNDGKFFFYTSNEDIYWVSSEVINDLKPLLK